MFIIRKEFAFSASHQLSGLPENHPCSKLHGHNYTVIVELRGPINSVGFVKDYRELDLVKRYIDSHLDHGHLNDLLLFNPTAELLAKFLYDEFKQYYPELYAVEVCETPKTMARYEHS